ncbi:MAG: glycosyltransferase [Butyribacter sp.]|nr:glycosyltransferase [bacterium]MDY3853384.1 glycosyltransferase [Butyribacter sp.]
MIEEKKTPDISVIILTYQTPLMILKRCIASVQKQSLKNIEILLVDSNSPHSSYKKAIQSETDILEGLSYLEIPEKGEFVKGKNAAIKACNGKYITFLSSQDMMPKERLQEILLAFREDEETDYDAIYTDMAVQQKNILESTDDYDIKTQTYQFLSQLVIRRSAFQKLGTFDNDLVALCDEDMWFRIHSLLQVYHLSSPNTTIFVSPDFYQRPAAMQSAIGYRQIAVKYAPYYKTHKKQKKALYYKIAAAYKDASVFFRYIQFMIKAFFIGNFSHNAKEATTAADTVMLSLTPDTASGSETPSEGASSLSVSETPAEGADDTALSDFLLLIDENKNDKHLALISNDEKNTLYAAEKIVQHMKKAQQLTVGKIAYISADKLNEININKYKEQLSGDCLLVEHAENLRTKAVRQLSAYVKKGKNDFAIILAFSPEQWEEKSKTKAKLKKSFHTIINVEKELL